MNQPVKKLTHADECELVLVELATAPVSLETIGDRLKMPTWRVNDIVCALRLAGKVAMTTERIKGKGKVNLYTLKIKAA
jgi:hypothetical protein